MLSHLGIGTSERCTHASGEAPLAPLAAIFRCQTSYEQFLDSPVPFSILLDTRNILALNKPSLPEGEGGERDSWKEVGAGQEEAVDGALSCLSGST